MENERKIEGLDSILDMMDTHCLQCIGIVHEGTNEQILDILDKLNEDLIILQDLMNIEKNENISRIVKRYKRLVGRYISYLEIISPLSVINKKDCIKLGRLREVEDDMKYENFSDLNLESDDDSEVLVTPKMPYIDWSAITIPKVEQRFMYNVDLRNASENKVDFSNSQGNLSDINMPTAVTSKVHNTSIVPNTESVPIPNSTNLFQYAPVVTSNSQSSCPYTSLMPHTPTSNVSTFVSQTKCSPTLVMSQTYGTNYKFINSCVQTPHSTTFESPSQNNFVNATMSKFQVNSSNPFIQASQCYVPTSISHSQVSPVVSQVPTSILNNQGVYSHLNLHSNVNPILQNVHNSVPGISNLVTNVQPNMPVTVVHKVINVMPPEPEVFSGKVSDYKSWKLNFQGYVNVVANTEQFKMAYLSKFIGNIARICIEPLFCCDKDDVYSEAFGILDEKFGNREAIIVHFHRKIQQTKEIEEGNVEALEVYRNLFWSLENQTSASHEPNGAWIKSYAMKLPLSLRSSWVDVKLDQKEKGKAITFECWMNFINKQLKLMSELRTLNPAENIDNSNGSSVNKVKGKEKNIGLQKSVLANISNNPLLTQNFSSHSGVESNFPSISQSTDQYQKVNFQHPVCTFCQNNHYTDVCYDLLANVNYKRRINLIYKYRLCFGCLTHGHISRECTQKVTCQICFRKHPTILHRNISNSVSYSKGFNFQVPNFPPPSNAVNDMSNIPNLFNYPPPVYNGIPNNLYNVSYPNI